jgi:hypothetical protein
MSLYFGYTLKKTKYTNLENLITFFPQFWRLENSKITWFSNFEFRFYGKISLIKKSLRKRVLLQLFSPCLMHRCVCIWQYILQNYNYKLHFQNLFIYDIPHVSMGTLAAENLDVCTAGDSWDSNIQLTMGIDRRRQIYPNHANRPEMANIPQLCSTCK